MDSLGSRAGTLTAPQDAFSRPRNEMRSLVPRPNYHQAKKQKELSRKARQLEKQRRRMARPNGSEESSTPSQDPPVGPSDPASSGGT